MHNSKGLPLRPGEVDCPFYVKTGSCKYGACCCYHHPDRNEINLSADAIGHTVVASTAANLNINFVNPVASIYQALDPRLSHAMFYMKTGVCKFGERCKFHHLIERSAPSLSNQAAQQSLKLTLAG